MRWVGGAAVRGLEGKERSRFVDLIFDVYIDIRCTNVNEEEVHIHYIYVIKSGSMDRDSSEARARVAAVWRGIAT